MSSGATLSRRRNDFSQPQFHSAHVAIRPDRDRLRTRRPARSYSGRQSGKRVALIEKREVIGGVCINTGTIPSKTMREAVLHFPGINYQNIYGISYRVKEKITMADLAFRVQHVIKTEIDVTQAQLSRNNIEMLTGRRVSRTPHSSRRQIARRNTRFKRENIIIATGTKPATSPKVPINGRTIINSDQILDMPDIPRHPDRGRGRRHRRRVYVHVRDSGRARHIDREAARGCSSSPTPRWWKRSHITSATPGDDAAERRGRERRRNRRRMVVANLESKKRVSGDALLYAVGRQGNVDELNLAAAGLESDAAGRIAVDETTEQSSRTSSRLETSSAFPASPQSRWSKAE